MKRRGQSGGLICINSFINGADRKEAQTFSERVASVSLRESATKEGLQSLYADPEEVFKKYKDFDIAKAMSERKGEDLLWVRARAIDADVVNANGDYFSEEELLKDVDIQGKVLPAYKTFEGVPIYTNHKNDDIEEAKGMVVYAEWDEDEKCVWCTFFIDSSAYPHISRGIRQGYMHDVSMGCQVEAGICSECNNKAITEKDYCDHLKKYKGKVSPTSKKKVYEKNLGLKFIELSVVGDGAFESCEIEEIYDVDEILQKAVGLEKKAEVIHGSIMLAGAVTPTEREARQAYEQCLRAVAQTTNMTVKLAQAAGTLVGGPLMASDGANHNATVSAILQGLGIDPSAGLNVMDMLNLALNFLEVSVMNLFARKDNVDLAHVAKITKSMSDLQAAMQDMIDDGVDTGGGSGKGAPLNQGAMQGQGGGQAPGGAQPAAPGGAGAGAPMNPAAQQTQNNNYNPAGNVGRLMTQNQSFLGGGMPNGVGDGVFAETKKPILVWASSDKEKREVYASTSNTKNGSSEKPNSVVRLCEAVASLAQNLDSPVTGQFASKPRVAENTNPKKTAPATRVSHGGSLMDFLTRFANQYRTRKAAKVSLDFNVEDELGNRLTLSSDGTIGAYHNGQRVAWNENITEEQIVAIEKGNGAEVADQLLRSFASAMANNRTVMANWTPETDDDVKEHMLESKRTGTDDKVKERMLEDSKAGDYGRKGTDKDVKEHILEPCRTGTDDDVKEHLLENEAGLYKRQFSDDDVKEHLIADARRGNPDVIIEHQLENVRKNHGPAADSLVAASLVNAVGRAVFSARVTPDEMVEAAQKLASREDVAELIKLASLGVSYRQKVAARNEFHRVASAELAGENALLAALGEAVTNEVLAADIASALRVATTDESKALFLKAVTREARNHMGEGSELEPAAVNTNISREDRLRAAFVNEAVKGEQSLLAKNHVKAALSAMAMSVSEMKSAPKEVAAAISNMEDGDLLAAVELARTSSATEARLVARERAAFWNKQNTRVASKTTVAENVIGWLADYADTYEFPSAAIVEVAKRVASQPEVAEKLIGKIVEAHQGSVKEAAVQVTDEKSTVKRVMCTTQDLGVDPADENWEQSAREKIMHILTASGYSVDPNTFAITQLSVTGDNVTAEISQRVSRSLDGVGTVDATTTAAPAPTPTQGPEEVANNQQNSDIPTEVTVDATPEEGTVMTASARASRKAKRDAILGRYAQMMPGMGAMPMAGGAGAGGAGAAGGGVPGDLGMAGDMGVSSMTSDPAAAGANADPTGGDKSSDGMAEPGTKKPWGSICPQCGSTDVDVANGEGNCNSCSAKLKYTFNVEVVPEGDKDKGAGTGVGDDKKDTGADAAGGLGADAGLGAATAPAPAGGGAPGGAAGAPAPAGVGGPMAAVGGMMVRTSWVCEPDVFIRTASPDFNRDSEKVLPVGFICPSCGNRHASKHRDQTICLSCATVSKSEIRTAGNDSSKLEVSIVWVV